MKFRSLRVRLALWALLLLGVAYIVMGFVFYTSNVVWLEGQVDHTLLVTASQIATVLTEDGETPDPGDLKFQSDPANRVLQTVLHDQLLFVRLIDRQNGPIVESSPDGDPVPVTSQSRSEVANYETVLSDQAEMRVYTVPLPVDAPLNLQMGMALTSVRQTQAQILRSLIVGFMVIALLALGSGWFLANRALIPILAITRTAGGIDESDLSRRLDLSTSEVELTQLVQTFNAMLERIEQAFKRQRQFTADAAHELRTPLSIIQTGLDVTLSQERSTVEYRSALESVHEEVQRLSQLANTLLRLARDDARESSLVKQSLNLSFLLETVTEQFEALAQDKSITLKRDIVAGLHVLGDEEGLIQVVYNLLDNALKYTPKDGTVCVKATQERFQVQVTISDTGPGISSADQSRIFDRFYRVDRARSRQQGGFGLGLAIVKQIVDLHNGSIRVISQPGQGAQFVVTLPNIRDMQA